MKNLKYILYLLVVLFVSSCFEIVEQVKLNKDGTGDLKLIVNMSQSKTKLKSIMLMEKVNGYRVPQKDEIKKEGEDMANIAKKVEGISDVYVSSDFDNYIFTFSCTFKNTDALNEMIYQMAKSKDKKGAVKKQDYLSYDPSSKKAIRSFDFLWKEKYQQLKSEDKEVFESATYTGIYRFDETITTATNNKTKISPNKKASMLRLNINDIINERATIANEIKL